MVPFNDIGAHLTMRRFGLEALAFEIGNRYRFESGIKCFEIQIAMPERA
jgi:hypothetical protein